MNYSDFCKNRDLLNTIRFDGLENYNIGTALTIPLNIEFEKNNISRTSIIIALFFLQFEYLYRNGNDILFLYTHSYVGRNDHEQTFLNVAELDKASALLLAKSTKRYFSHKYIKHIILLRQWKRQIKAIPFNKKQKINLLFWLLSIKVFSDYLEESVDYKKIQLAVTWCDAHVFDNIATQTFKLKGITTATLQHGQFCRLDEVDPSDGFENFVSDYFLMWGPYSKNEAIKAGIPEDKIKCLGIPKFIGKNSIVRNDWYDQKLFGLILDGNGFEKDNLKLIQDADYLAQKTGFKYYVKIHPGASFTDYSFSNQYLEAVVPKSCTVEEFLTKIDFALVCNSSVFFELVYQEFPVFRKRPAKESIDVYEGIEECTYEDVAELEYLCISKSVQEQYSLEEKLLKSKICATGDIGENYKKFFAQFKL